MASVSLVSSVTQVQLIPMEDLLLGYACEECLPIEMCVCNEKYMHISNFESWDYKGIL